MTTRFVAHLREDNGEGTLCGEPWQNWQRPENSYLAREPIAGQKIHQCQGCLRVSQLLARLAYERSHT